MAHLIAPSLLASDFANLQKECEMLNESQADWYHLDVMDGAFVPNISFGIPVIKAMRKHSDKVFDVHLMVEKPERYIQDFKDAGADILTVHVEASTHLHRSIYAIKDAGMKAGVALNPHTPLSSIEEVVADADLFCLMSVNPGFGGQKFIESVLDKTARLKQIILSKNSAAVIEIDGGVSMQNARKLVDAGADVLVAGSSVFKAPDPKQAIIDLKSC
jgi:ribulose-phosphate 3-epimerase